MNHARGLVLIAASATLVGCGVFTGARTPSGTAETDREARVIATAIEYPRQPDAASFARTALAIWKGAGTLSVLEATDLHTGDSTKPAARLVVRIHTPAVVGSEGFGDHRAYDACYRLEYEEPSSSLIGEPRRIDCPVGAAPVTPTPAAPVQHLPTDAASTLARVLRTVPSAANAAAVEAALRSAFPSSVVVNADVIGGRIAGAVSVPHPMAAPDCEIALRTGGRVTRVWPEDPIVLMPGESGCRADLAFHPALTH